MGSAYRAAVIGLGRIASTFDDEQGPWSVWRGPHAHTPSYLAAGVPVVAGADPHDGQRTAYRRKWGIEIALQPTTVRCWNGSGRTS